MKSIIFVLYCNSRYPLPAPNLSSKPLAAAAAVDRRDRQTDGLKDRPFYFFNRFMTLTAYFFSDVVKLTVHKKYCNPLKFMTHCISAELIPCKGGRDFVQIYDMMSYFNVHAKADTSQVNLPSGTKQSKSAKNYSKSGLPHFY